MKKSLIAIGALFALSIASVANADLSFNQTAGTGVLTEQFNVSGLPTIAANGTNSVSLGELDSSGAAGTITFTYLGHESGFTNQFQITIGTMGSFNTTSSVGDQLTLNASDFGSGAVPVEFMTISGGSGTAVNGGTPGSGWSDGTSIGLIGTNMTDTATLSPPGGTYAFVLGFNDAGGVASGGSLNDWDDLVVGVNFVSAVPEPQVYTMMGIGLLLMGFVARRRNLF